MLPGRLADLIQGSRPPKLSKIQFLVLDEADRLFDRSFAPDLATIFAALPTDRQTLLFSATMDKNITEMEELGGADLHKWKATERSTAVDTLDQRYLFMPAMVKTAYLYKLLDLIGPGGEGGARVQQLGGKKTSEKRGGGGGRRGGGGGYGDEEEERDPSLPPRLKSIIIFVHTCHDCQMLYETLLSLHFNVVCLHSQLTQRRRLAALGKFKDSIAPILIATDVAARGLDIPEVCDVVFFLLSSFFFLLSSHFFLLTSFFSLLSSFFLLVSSFLSLSLQVGAVVNYDIPRAIESYVREI